MAGSRLLQFTTVEQDYPEKRAAQDRAHDFQEISQPFILAKAEEQAGRCSQCGVPFCSIHCPLGNHIPDWLSLAAQNRLEEAYALSASTSSMPEICGRICPQDRLCEGNCVIEQSTHGAVTIGAVEKFLTDTAWQEGWVTPLRPLANLEDQSIGIIGSGPAGLTAAEALRREGYKVDVYDRHDRMGGLLTYGIPGFKLEKHIVMRRVERLAEGGVQFHAGIEIGKDISMDDLRRKHDAVLIATGVYRARDLDIPGGDLAGVIPALTYLTTSNRKGFGDHVPQFESGELNAQGRRVVVIGGGDTAMDCVRTALRQGAREVTCLYRRDRENMPGSRAEVRNAEEEGAHFEWLSAPHAFTGQDRVHAVQATRMRLTVPDASGRYGIEEAPESGFTVEADMVIKALGFEPEDLPCLFDTPELEVTRWGTVRADGTTGETNLKGVYAAGDIVRGASLVVWAIRDGRETAAAIHRQLCDARRLAVAS